MKGGSRGGCRHKHNVPRIFTFKMGLRVLRIFRARSTRDLHDPKGPRHAPLLLRLTLINRRNAFHSTFHHQSVRAHIRSLASPSPAAFTLHMYMCSPITSHPGG